MLYYKKSTILPVTKSKVNIIYHDAQDLVVRLLTDPRFTDDDFAHYNNDPLAAPPEGGYSYIEELHTGKDYIQAYKKHITNPEKQMLVPVMFYIDGAVTGQFDKLSVETLKMSLGILTTKARMKPYAWLDLGQVPNHHKSSSRGKKILKETGHDASTNLPMSDEEGAEESSDSEEELEETEGNPEIIDPDKYEYDEDMHEGQDWHHVLSILLLSYRKLEQQGMKWHYRYRGKVHQDIELVFYVAMVKCDGEEADKLCGKYTTRTGNVKTLCRYCCCPTGHSDWVYGDKYPVKTEAMVKRLVERKDSAGLQSISQRNLLNAFHGLRFGHPTGIHGACPMDLLHHILLGMFKYVVVGLQEQIGPTSKIIDEINAIAREYGRLFSRQSDRDLPKTTFTKGIFQGKIMGKEHSGVLLLIAVVLQSAIGREKLKKNPNFHDSWLIDDWVLLVETMLQWEAFLKLDLMQKKHVRKLKEKHRYLMFLTKKVLRRTKGMGLKVMKFHGILHLAEDILRHGVPSAADTSPNESHHKGTKSCAKRTQREIETFEEQTTQRLDEYQLIEEGMAELDGKYRFDYFRPNQSRGPIILDQQENNMEELTEDTGPKTGGARVQVYKDEDSGEIQWSMTGDIDAAWPDDILEYLSELQELAEEEGGGSRLEIRCQHKRNGQIFRAHPNYRRKGSWNDWVTVDWGRNHGQLPGEIWCFVDFSDLPEDIDFDFKGSFVRKGVFAVIETTVFCPNKTPTGETINKSDLFIPIVKQAEELHPNGDIKKRQFWLANVESFVEPIAVVPDIGNSNKLRYFKLVHRRDWAEAFTDWLDSSFQDEEAEIHTEETEDQPAPDPPKPPIKRKKNAKKRRRRRQLS